MQPDSMVLRELELSSEGLERVQRGALYVAAVVRTVTEPILMRLLQLDDAGPAYDWLARLPFMSSTGSGLQLDSSISEPLFQQLRRRAPELLDDFRQAALCSYCERLKRARSSLSLDPAVYSGSSIYDALYLIRDCPSIEKLGIKSQQPYHAVTGSDEDKRRSVDAVRAHEGQASADLCEQWLNRDDTELVVLREPGREPVAFALLCRVGQRQTGGPHSDPVVRAFYEDTVLRPSETAVVCRFAMSFATGHTSHPARGCLLSLITQRLAFSSGVAAAATVHAEPSRSLVQLGSPHRVSEPVQVDGMRQRVDIYDWRREPPEEWFQRWIRSLAAGMPFHSTPCDDGMILFERMEFFKAVRTALRLLAQPEKLAEHPLARAPVVLRQGVGANAQDAGEALYRTLLEQINRLEGAEQHATVLRQTYVDGGTKQLAIAEELGMSFGTYRRRLTVATERLAARLWRAELSAA